MTAVKGTGTAASGLLLESVFSRLDAELSRGLSALGGRKDGEPIRELHLELTHRCNLRCVMCHHWEMPFDDPSSVAREMSLDDVRRLVDGAKALDDIEIVVLTGGEPMLRPDIVDIAAFLSGRYRRASLGILTNFWNTELIRRRLTALKERGLGKVWLGSSLDGLEPAHDEIRGRPGSFAGLVRSIEMMREEFAGVDFSFSFTITPKNYRELWPAYRFVTGQGLWFGAQMVVNHQNLTAPETFSWTEAQISAVEEQIDLILGDICVKEGAWERLQGGRAADSLWLWTKLLYWRYLRKYARKPERFFPDCLAGQRYAMFDPEGNLFFCPVNKHRTVGNARNASFDALWTSRQAAAEREFVDSCRCDCWLNCIANPILDRAMALAYRPQAFYRGQDEGRR